MDQNTTCIVIYTTFPDAATAEKIISGLINEQLAACGNLFTIDSVYCWKNKVEHGPEIGAFIKTRASLYEQVEAYIKDNHPYEVPEIISWEIKRGSTQYLEWIAESTLNAKR